MENVAIAWRSRASGERVKALADPDQRLVSRCQAGDQASFAELVERHKAVVFSLVNRLVRNQADAEDVAQETFLKAYLNIKRFRGECSFRNWLCRIATRLSIDHLRAKRRRPVLFEEVEIGEQEDPSQRLDNRLEAEMVAEAIAELPPHYRAALELRHLQHFSYAEVAKALQVPLSTVKTHLLRGHLLLRQRLGPLLGRDPGKGRVK